jgi:hypothetical protein
MRVHQVVEAGITPWSAPSIVPRSMDSASGYARRSTLIVLAMSRDGLEQFFRGTGVRRLRINSLAVNMSAQASYEHAGFGPYEILYDKIISEVQEL